MILYVVVAIVVVAATVAGLLAYSSAKSTQKAEQKADQLIAALQKAGARTPSRDQIVRVLGDDGGAVCANPNQALTRATLNAMLTNGAGGPGIRPVIVDRRVLLGELLIIQVYCPDKLPRFQQLVNNLKSAHVVRE
jgi:hypothetical protein